MRAYKFLHAVDGGDRFEGPFSGFAWPLPAPGAAAAVVHCRGPLEPGRHGVSACRLRDLPYWISDSLWSIELSGEIVEIEGAVVAAAGRLEARVAGWDASGRRDFAAACVERLRERTATVLLQAGQGPAAAAIAPAAPVALADAARGCAATLDRTGRPALVRLLDYVGDAAEYADAAGEDGGATAARSAASSAAAAAYVCAHATRYAAHHVPGWRGGRDDPELAERDDQSAWFRTLGIV